MKNNKYIWKNNGELDGIRKGMKGCQAKGKKQMQAGSGLQFLKGN